MGSVWFVLVTFMLVMFVVLDGFDIGAGILHLFVAKSEEERSTILRAIGPVWDGNEVWLIATGGTLYFAFPRLYASSFSGFYLPLTIVLWLLIARGLSIELRRHIDSALWHSFFDVLFSISSMLLAVVFGAALGNVVRGVPLSAQGYFFEPFWTTFTIVPEAGILDWYTVLLGVVALCTLANHGANYLALKTIGSVQHRARRVAMRAWAAVLVLSAIAAAVTFSLHPDILSRFQNDPLLNVFPSLALLGLVGGWVFRHRTNRERAWRDLARFLASSLFIAGMLASTAAGLYPVLLRASTDPQFNLTIANSSAADHGLSIGLVWWSIGMVLVSAYFVFVYRTFRGKVD